MCPGLSSKASFLVTVAAEVKVTVLCISQPTTVLHASSWEDFSRENQLKHVAIVKGSILVSAVGPEACLRVCCL